MHMVETEKNSNALPVGEKFMLTIKEAAPYYNIGKKSCVGLQRITLVCFQCIAETDT